MEPHSQPSFADMFCGAGGLSLGLIDAGFTPVFALDNDPWSVKTHKKRVSNKVKCWDAQTVTSSRILKATKLQKGQIQLVCGGPPCQGFSVQRRGERNDRRNDLLLKFGKLATGIAPKLILMENVPTILGPRGREHMDELLTLISKEGYAFRTKVLDAADYGVPQHRRRAFLIAWAADQTDPGPFPSPTHSKDTWRSVRDAIADLPEPPEDYREHPIYPNHTRVNISQRNETRIAYVPPGGGRLDIPPSLQLDCHRNAGTHRHLDVYGRMEWDKPAPTITAMFDNFTRGRFAHPVANRSITGREGARLQSFPDDFRFLGPKKDVARQIGNSVPPKLARVLGKWLKAALSESSAGSPPQLRKPSKTNDAIAPPLTRKANV